MSMASIRKHYGVPACRGGLVRFQGVEATITSADRSDEHLWLRIPGLGRPAKVHPTWEMEYILCDNVDVDRHGNEGPCERPAMGYRIDTDFGNRYPVCREHHVPPFEACTWRFGETVIRCKVHGGDLVVADSDWCDKAFEVAP